jgi:hypothetical protein
MSEIRDYQVDHLLLLVGSNPLANAVAGKPLTTTQGTLTLINSRAADSLELAQKLNPLTRDHLSAMGASRQKCISKCRCRSRPIVLKT